MSCDVESLHNEDMLMAEKFECDVYDPVSMCEIIILVYVGVEAKDCFE